MQEAVAPGLGKMTALLGGEDEAVIQLCARATETARSQFPNSELTQIVEPANFNAPGQIVISGTAEAVDSAISLAKEAKIKSIPLNVSAPFHCALMKPAREKMNALLEKITVNALKNSYIPNRTARISNEAGNIKALLSEQVDHAVMWKQSMLTALHSGNTYFTEFGSGNVLCGLLKRIAKDQPGADTLKMSGISDVESLQSWK